MTKRELRSLSPKYRELEDIRLRRGLTRASFACRLNITIGTYYNYRQARNPSRSVMALARIIDTAG